MIIGELTTKGKIERAALQLFAAEGVDAVSVRRIAQAAGVSQGALYTHYPSKDALAWKLFAANYSHIGHQVRQLVRGLDGVAEKMRAIVGHIYTCFENDMDLWSYVFFARHAFIKRVSADMGNTYLVVQVVIAEAIRKKQIPRQNIELATSVISGVILQVADNRILGRLKTPLTDLADYVSVACLRVLEYPPGSELAPGNSDPVSGPEG